MRARVTVYVRAADVLLSPCVGIQVEWIVQAVFAMSSASDHCLRAMPQASSAPSMHAIVEARLQQQAAQRKRHAEEGEADRRRRSQLLAALLAKKRCCAGATEQRAEQGAGAGAWAGAGAGAGWGGGGGGELAEHAEQQELEALAAAARDRDKALREGLEAARVRVAPVGHDRHGRAYWVFPAFPTEIIVAGGAGTGSADAGGGCRKQQPAGEERTAGEASLVVFTTPAALDGFLSHPRDESLRRALSQSLAPRGQEPAALRACGAAAVAQPPEQPPGSRPASKTWPLPPEPWRWLLPAPSLPSALNTETRDFQGTTAWMPRCERVERLGAGAPSEGFAVGGATWGAGAVAVLRAQLLAVDDLCPWGAGPSFAAAPRQQPGPLAAAPGARADACLVRNSAWRSGVEAVEDGGALFARARELAVALEACAASVEQVGGAARRDEGDEGDEGAEAGGAEGRLWPRCGADCWRALLRGKADAAPHVSSTALAILLLGSRAKWLAGKLEAMEAPSPGAEARGARAGGAAAALTKCTTG